MSAFNFNYQRVLIFLLSALASLTGRLALADGPPVGQLISDMVKRYEAVTDYTCKLDKKVRKEGVLYEDLAISVKYKKPMHYYFRWEQGPARGREVIYVHGRNNNQLVAHPGGGLRFLTLRLDPTGRLAMKAIITSAALAWLVAQVLKVLIGFLRFGSGEKPRTLWRMIWAGGMPSAHSALVTASTLTLFWSCGPQSSLYGFALVMTGIVIYDRSRMFAIYMAFQKKFPALEREVRNDPLLQDLVGHRPLEIIAGILVGLAAGFLTHALLPI